MGISVPAVVLAAQSACGVDGSVDGDVTLLKSLALLDKDYGTIHGYAEVYYASHRWCQLYESLATSKAPDSNATHGLNRLESLEEPFFSKRKGLSDCSESPTGGEYEIRTREAVTPTRFPSVRHRPLGEFSNYATLCNGHLQNAT